MIQIYCNGLEPCIRSRYSYSDRLGNSRGSVLKYSTFSVIDRSLDRIVKWHSDCFRVVVTGAHWIWFADFCVQSAPDTVTQTKLGWNCRSEFWEIPKNIFMIWNNAAFVLLFQIFWLPAFSEWNQNAVTVGHAPRVISKTNHAFKKRLILWNKILIIASSSLWKARRWTNLRWQLKKQHLLKIGKLWSVIDFQNDLFIQTPVIFLMKLAIARLAGRIERWIFMQDIWFAVLRLEFCTALRIFICVCDFNFVRIWKIQN